MIIRTMVECVTLQIIEIDNILHSLGTHAVSISISNLHRYIINLIVCALQGCERNVERLPSQELYHIELAFPPPRFSPTSLDPLYTDHTNPPLPALALTNARDRARADSVVNLHLSLQLDILHTQYAIHTFIQLRADINMKLSLSLSLTLLTTLPFTLAIASAPEPRDAHIAYLKRTPSNEAHVPLAHDISSPSSSLERRDAEPEPEPENKAHIPITHDPAPPPEKRKLGKRINIMKGVGEIILRPAKEELKDDDAEEWRQIATKKWRWREGLDGDDQGQSEDVAQQQQQEVEEKLQEEDNRKKQAEQAKKEQEQKKKEG
jgi:hypothetical protein